jgi:hypothetical protein
VGRFLLFLFGLGALVAVFLLYSGHTESAILAGIAAAGVLLLWFHFLPTFIAYGREHPNRMTILLLNLLLGWTLVGWLAALIWACMALQQPAPVRGFADGGPTP